MNRNVMGAITAVLVIFTASISFGHASYTGYSGALGSRGTCASSCHGGGGGTIQITGFPEQYEPGQTYTITVAHSGGSSIRQFNGSCRIGSGSQNAGFITAGARTTTYNVTAETNGIHLSSTNQNDGIFTWTAPPSGTGEIRLYIAGLQGGLSGANSTITLTSSELATGINDTDRLPNRTALLENFPNPFNASTKIRFSTSSAGPVALNIYSLLGQQVTTLFAGNVSAGDQSVTWDAARYPSGVYICELRFEGGIVRRGITLLK